ncbi:zinc finger 213-like [Solea senegalensis]|uniref:Zinc finger 213-like n=1 Tax=Solea senegalensis TaxID=28829 RepID=A0AAV6RUV3_SOLSE|nr:zinc finger 213-like [Solea senegalensis]
MRPERRSKERFGEKITLEQLLQVLPPDTRTWCDEFEVETEQDFFSSAVVTLRFDVTGLLASSAAGILRDSVFGGRTGATKPTPTLRTVCREQCTAQRSMHCSSLTWLESTLVCGGTVGVKICDDIESAETCGCGLMM